MAAMAGATGARSWLQAAHLTWLTPRRLRVATIVLFLAALLVSSVALSGTTKPQHQRAAQVRAVATANSR
jgi:hypothetical protein